MHDPSPDLYDGKLKQTAFLRKGHSKPKYILLRRLMNLIAYTYK